MLIELSVFTVHYGILMKQKKTLKKKLPLLCHHKNVVAKKYFFMIEIDGSLKISAVKDERERERRDTW